QEIRRLTNHLKPFAKPACTIISPHGSLSYSGAIAAAAWGSLVGSCPSLIIIVGPAHLPYEEGVFLPESVEFEMPGGSISLDVSLIEYVSRMVPEARRFDLPHLEDHSIEMQLPFARHFFPGVPILPVIVSGYSEHTITLASRLLEEIKACTNEDVVLVISSDLAVSDTPEHCDRLSRQFMERLCEPSRDTPLTSMTDDHHSFCGAAIIEAFCRIKTGSRPEILSYANSSEHRSSIDEFVVGYGAICFKR
ncbi:MAG: AmmeMemoRadiSam system protein B, partial [Rectinema sp.]|nr:AmmeMemoRadiSam system protein B [Rectinema sp.]